MSADFDVSIVIPTFREQSNLLRLLPSLFEVLKTGNIRGEVLVVDDDSNDGTDLVCREMAARYPLRLVTRRGERGLATAVIRGLNDALGRIVVVMDADLSHPPSSIPALLAAIQATECDIAVGSRYVLGGSVDSNWSSFRRINSKVATWMARGLTKASDPLSGFFAVPKATLSRGQTLRPIGYKILLEIIVRCDCRRIVEIPIAFKDRELGLSKLSARQQWLYLRHLGRLYAERLLFHRSFANEPSAKATLSAGPLRDAA